VFIFKIYLENFKNKHYINYVIEIFAFLPFFGISPVSSISF
jgi:hypothetical protein